MKKSIIYLLFFFAVCAFSPNRVIAQTPNRDLLMGIQGYSLDFGNVFVGTTKTLTFGIEHSWGNDATQSLLISWNTINQPFSISPVGPVGISFVQSKYFTITFHPTAAISYNQTNTLYNNATRIGPVANVISNANPQLSIHFIGTGVAIITKQILEKNAIENSLKSVKK